MRVNYGRKKTNTTSLAELLCNDVTSAWMFCTFNTQACSAKTIVWPKFVSFELSPDSFLVFHNY